MSNSWWLSEYPGVADRSSEGPVPLPVTVGGLTRAEIQAALSGAGVMLNASAEVLLNSALFDRPEPSESFYVVPRTLQQLGLRGGAALPAIFEQAQSIGLLLCPAITAPYLRLLLVDQPPAPDNVMSNGSAPSGSLTVASVPLTNDDEFPKGFYLRVVERVLWLRGYHASEQHIWAPEDCFLFRRG